MISGGTQCMVISLGEEENDRGSVRIHKSQRPLPWQQWLLARGQDDHDDHGPLGNMATWQQWLLARGQDDNDYKNHDLRDSRGICISLYGNSGSWSE